MQLIVGLGNPGPNYQHTRHNVGFMVIDELAQRWGMRFTHKPALRAEIAEGWLGEEKMILIKPQTYMNDSGLAVQATCAMFGVEVSRIVVLSDDVALPFGTVRVRTSGSSGGHKGLASLITHLNSPDFVRIRIGVDAPPTLFPLENWVLGNLTTEQRTSLLKMIPSIDTLLQTGFTQGFTERTV